MEFYYLVSNFIRLSSNRPPVTPTPIYLRSGGVHERGIDVREEALPFHEMIFFPSNVTIISACELFNRTDICALYFLPFFRLPFHSQGLKAPIP